MNPRFVMPPGSRLEKSIEAMGTPAASVLCDPQKKAAMRSGVELTARGERYQTTIENINIKSDEKSKVSRTRRGPAACQTPLCTLWLKEAKTMKSIRVLLTRLKVFFEAIAHSRTNGRISCPATIGSRIRSEIFPIMEISEVSWSDVWAMK